MSLQSSLLLARRSLAGSSSFHFTSSRPAAAAIGIGATRRAASTNAHTQSPSSSPSPPSSFSSLAASSTSFLRRVSLLVPPIWTAAGIPKGFERFFPNGPKKRNTNKKMKEEKDGKEGKEENEKEEEEGENRMNASGDDKEGGGSKRNNKKKKSEEDEDEEFSIPWSRILLTGGAGLVLATLLFDIDGQELTFQEFKTRYLEQHLVDRLEVNPGTKKVTVILKKPGSIADGQAIIGESTSSTQSSSSTLTSQQVFHFYIGSVESFERALEETQREMGVDPHDFVSVRYGHDSQVNWLSLAFQVAFYGAIFYFGRQMLSGAMGGGGKGKNNPFSFGKSTAQIIKPGESKVTFKDVAGLDEAKVEVLEFVKFLQAPERFKRLGAKIPKGALLCGPPGTGKTLLAKAVAGEAGVPFFSISGSDFLEMFVGVGPSRVRDLFAQARSNTPCIIFIDEIDAVGRARSKGGYSGGNDERENTLNQLLVEMDGMGTTEGVVVLAGTNRKDMLDKALLRPGRFDRHITIDKPDMKGRAQIFMVHLAKLKTDERHTRDDLAQRLAALTPGFAGADIANLCNEAALIAARANKMSVELVDFETASDRVIGGLEKKSSTMTKEEKALVAHHEAGHAVAAWFLEHADPLLKVTIVPRGGGALGFAQYLPKELSLYHQGQLADMMAMALGGRAAEQIFFGRVSTGASDDLQKVTRIAQAQVTTYGMSARLGNVSYAPGQDENQFVKPYSEATAQAIDEEVRDLIASTYTRVLALLETHRVQVKALADKLIETENVNHDVLVELLGPRPFASDAYTTWRKQSAEAAELIKKTKKEAEEAAAAAAAAHKGTPEFATA